MSDSFPFLNAPVINTQTVGAHLIIYQNHHVISSEAFDGSTFMKALAKAGLWNQCDYHLSRLLKNFGLAALRGT
ncbi:hypothetical protein JMM63_18055 [Rhodovulum sulfidophilum]|uniref:hypothetical protein n=1 Tax=Rhodovulum sulfidophilum TaxID=35806 RepID=UPI0019220EE6|nr:hypothetical protein [Rhodovulum sulfidophilum]MBL3597439.1 hypothetical protein [Rhodovulum sulfidophilum]